MPAPERPPIEPHLSIAISSPAPDSNLTRSRIGSRDPVIVRVTGELARIDYIWVRVSQSGISDYDSSMRPLGNDRYQADISFIKPGPAVLRAYAEWTSTAADETFGEAVSQPVSVTVAPTERPQIVVFLNDVLPAANGDTPQIPVRPGGEGQAVRVKVQNAPHIHSVTVQCRANGNDLPPVPLDPSNDGWTDAGRFRLPESAAPGKPLLFVRDTDHFGATNETAVSFTTVDNTPPTIEINEPPEVVISPENLSSTNPLRIVVRGTVRDSQSNFQEGTLTYSFGSQTNVQVPVINGGFIFEVAIETTGFFQVTLTGKDVSNNVGQAVRRFEAISSFKPKSLDELLSPRAYLWELLRVVSNQIVDGNETAINSDIVSAAFKQPFSELAQPNQPSAAALISDLLTPARLLRDYPGPATAGLIARWTFAELAQQAPDGLCDMGGRFRLNGTYHGTVERMYGKP